MIFALKIVLWGLAILLLIIVIRRLKSGISLNKLSTNKKKVLNTAGKTALVGSMLGGGYLLYIRLGLIAIAVVAVIGLFIILKLRSGSGIFSGALGNLGFGSSSNKRNRNLNRLQNKYNTFKARGWSTKWENPDHSYLRVHKGDQTWIYYVDEDGEWNKYDPATQWEWDESSTTAKLGGYDVSDLTKVANPDGTYSYYTPDDELVTTTTEEEFDRAVTDITRDATRNPYFRKNV